MGDNRYRLLTEMAANQYGVFTRSDLRDVGLCDSTISNGLVRGRFRALLPGVYAIAGTPDSRSQRMMAHVLSMPERAAISHRTAAELWGLTEPRMRAIDIVTTRWDRVRRTEVAVHESTDLSEEDIARRNGIPVTTPARTVVDLGAVAPWVVESALESGIRHGHFTVGEVSAFVARVARKGRRGVGVIRPLLEARMKWDSATESMLEDLFRTTVDELALPQPVSQYIVRDEHDAFVCRADFAYPQERILIELDSEAHHMDRLTFRRDRSKQNRAVVLGWTVLRYTWWDLRDDPFRVGMEIRTALTTASGGSGAYI